jgi:hypothetical protein
MAKEIWLHGRLPSRKRLSYEERAVLMIHNTDWREPDLAVALALSQAESAGDPKAYLAYVQLPHPAPHPVNEQIKTQIRALPKSTTFTTFRWKVAAIGAMYGRLVTVTNADRGVFQISKKWHPTVNNREAFDPEANIRYAHRIWEDWGRTFKAWAAFTTPRQGETDPPYKRFLARAREALENVDTTR